MSRMARQQGQLANLLRTFGQALALSGRIWATACRISPLVTMSEFGRTAHENGDRGTDHGHGNCMFVMGGNVKGGKVYGQWPGLEKEQLTKAATWPSPPISARSGRAGERPLGQKDSRSLPGIEPVEPLGLLRA